jgi:hypothetical protein
MNAEISNFIHTRKTYIAQELGDSRMARKVYCSESPKQWPLSVQSKCSKRVRSVSSNHVLRNAPFAFANMSNLNQVVRGSRALNSCVVHAPSNHGLGLLGDAFLCLPKHMSNRPLNKFRNCETPLPRMHQTH